MATLKTKLLLRNDTAANWTSSNPTLSKGEAGVEIDTYKLKIGDGTTPWNTLAYYGSSVVITGTGNTIVSAEFSNGVLTLTKGNRIAGTQTVSTTLGTDNTTIPTSKAVRDALGSVDSGVMSITVTDDDVVIGTPTTATSGAVTIDIKHAEKGANATKGPTADVTISGSGATGTIKVPKVVVDKYGHTTGLTEQTLSITMPTVPTIPNLSVTDTETGNVVTDVTVSNHTITLKRGLDVYSKTEVDNKIASATNAAVVMRGTLGTGGTITALPTASANLLGDAYKVITAATYLGQAAKVGDVFICYTTDDTNYAWMLITSGDDIEDTWRKVQLDGTDKLGSGITTGALNLKNVTANAITVAYSSGFTFDVKTGYTSSGKNYAVKKDTNGNLYVNVPWDNTTYGADRGISLVEGKFGHSNTVITALTTAGLRKIAYDTYGHITSSSAVTKADITGLGIPGSNTWRPVKYGTTTLNDTATTLEFVAGSNVSLSFEGGKLTIGSTNTTYDIVSTTKNGLAPAMTTNNGFLVRVGSAASPSWNAITIIDGGAASTTDWGLITA